jgi:DNA-directed RNA polymerase specialized sigma24 family protein
MRALEAVVIRANEAAIALDCAVGTVSSRLHRGRVLLLGSWWRQRREFCFWFQR